MGQIKIEFNGYDVVFNENQNRWESFYKGETDLITYSQSLKDLKAKIMATAKQKYPRVKVIIKDYGNNWIEGEVTSPAEASRYSSRKEFWVIVKKKRSKERDSSIYEGSDENKKIIAEATALKKEASKLYEKASQLEDKMKPFDGENYKPIEEGK